MELSQKALLISMTNGQGWLLTKNIGEAILKEMEHIALDSDDDIQVPKLVREAKAARKFWDAYLLTIDNAKSTTQTEDFVEVSM